MIAGYKIFRNWGMPVMGCMLLVGLLSGCKKLNPTEGIPAYLKIDSVFLNSNVQSQGTTQHAFSDVWVFIDDELVGAFELPATVPYLGTGKHKVQLKPGIKVNGIQTTRSTYPFIEFNTSYIDFVPGATHVINPTVNYFSGTVFPWLENFEGLGTSFIKNPTSDTGLVVNTVNPFEGAKSGLVQLDSTQQFFECISANKYILPKAGAKVFLEFNYKCNQEFVAGIYAYPTGNVVQIPALYLNATPVWKKIYIELTDEVSAQVNSDKFAIFFGLTKKSDTPRLELDNIKLIY